MFSLVENMTSLKRKALKKKMTFQLHLLYINSQNYMTMLKFPALAILFINYVVLG